MNFIPIFPLDLISFPSETLNLHIFEPPYVELVNDCLDQKRNFGIPARDGRDQGDLGTLMEITDVITRYSNGELDIKTRAVAVFRVLELLKPADEKLYGGAIVSYTDNVLSNGSSPIAAKLISDVKHLYELLNVQEKFPADTSGFTSYSLAHLVGLSRDQEYELLGIFTEIQRLEYIRRHLATITPLLRKLEDMKKRVQMNGHFQNLSAKDLNL